MFEMRCNHIHRNTRTFAIARNTSELDVIAGGEENKRTVC
jgi:hypothetical protein